LNETPNLCDVTGLLQRWGDGDAQALAEVASATYGDLRAVAASVLRRGGRTDTVQATGLVNELYIRLTRQHTVQFPSRQHFYAFAAFLMRRILVDHARQYAVRRQEMRVPLHEEMAWVDAAGEEIIALDRAMQDLASLDERKARVVELRFFLGCTSDETAEALGVSRATVERELQFAKAWLFARLHPETPDPDVTL
jgi:RNA polymerase sigma factor (TIGR02999 family)